MEFTGANIKDSRLLEIFEQWLRLDTITKEERWQNTSTVLNVLSVYSKLWRIPKLISKLLIAIDEAVLEHSCSVSFLHGYVDVSVLEAFAQCMQVIPFSQVLEIWELFITSFGQHLASAQQQHSGSTFIISQFFSTFLLHAQIFEETVLPVIQKKITLLLSKTCELIGDISSLLVAIDDKDLLKLSLLQMIHTYSEMKLVFSIYNSHATSKLKQKDENACCELKVHPLHAIDKECNVLNICDDLFKNNDRRLGYFAYKLLVHGIKANLVKKDLGKDEIEKMKSIVSLLTEVTLQSTSECCHAEWDFNVSSVDSTNFGVTFWNLFLSHFHLFIGFMSNKNLVLICSTMLEILVNDPENRSSTINCMSIHSSVSKFVSSNFFMESRQFQTAFITAIWKHAGSLIGAKKRSSSEFDSNKFDVALIFQELCSSKHKWEKYSLTTPKASEEMNAMWTMISTAADVLNNSLKTSPALVGRLKHADVEKLVKVFNFLPLEHLMPGNQVRCMLGLSTMLFLHSDAHLLPDNRESVQIILKLLIAIFEGVRSMWIFDFVHAIPYIKAVIYFMEQLHKLHFSDDLEICKKLLENIFKFASRNVESLSLFEDYLPELASHMQESQVSTAAFLYLLQRLIELLQRSYLPAPVKNISEKLANVACSSIAKAMHHWKTKDQTNFKIYLLLLSCYEGLIKLIVNPNCKFKENKLDKWLKHLNNALCLVFDNVHEKMGEDEENTFLSFICTVSIHRLKLDSHIPSEFSFQAWKFLRGFIAQKIKSVKEHLTFPSKGKTEEETDCFFCCNNNFVVMNDSSSNETLDFEKFVRKHIFTENVKEALTGIVQTSTEIEFSQIFQDLSDEIEAIPLDIAALNSVDFVVSLVTVGDLHNTITDEQSKLLMLKLIQNCFVKLSFLVNQTCNGVNCLLKVVLPSLNFISSSLKRGKGKLPKQCVIQCLYICAAVKAESVIENPVVFLRVYNSLWCTLTELLNHHSSHVISCIPALIPCIIHLLKLIVKASNQDLMMTYNDYHQKEILVCTQNFDKLVGLLIKQHEIELAKVVPYVIADYLDLVQNITVYPPAKVTFVLTINKLLDICSKHSLEMLAVNIKHSCREILNALVKNYHQTRFSGQI